MTEFFFRGTIYVGECETQAEAEAKLDMLNEDDSVYDAYQVNVTIDEHQVAGTGPDDPDEE